MNNAAAYLLRLLMVTKAWLCQVATPRVAKAVKAEIPCVDDPVGKLEDIGDKTKEKLNDLPAAAETCGAHALNLPFTGVTTGWSPARFCACQAARLHDIHPRDWKADWLNEMPFGCVGFSLDTDKDSTLQCNMLASCWM